MSNDLIKRAGFTSEIRTETFKPKVETPPPSVERPDSRAGDRALQGSLLKYKLQNMRPDFGGSMPADAPPANVVNSDREADRIIQKHTLNGTMTEDDAYAAGQDVASIAKTDPAKAAEIMNKVQEKLAATDKGDNVAEGFLSYLSDKELAAVAKAPGGREMLGGIKNHLLSGDVHDNEKADAGRIDDVLMSPTDAANAAAERVKGKRENFDGSGAKTLADESKRLTDLYGPEAAGQMMAKLYKDAPDELATTLRISDNLSDTEKQSIGQGLGEMYKNLSADEKKGFGDWVAYNIVGDAFTPTAGGNKSTSLGEILAGSSNTEMKTAVVNSIMDLAATIHPKMFGDNGGVDVQSLFKSAAIIADSAPSGERAAMLKKIVDTLPKISLPSLIKDKDTKDALSKLFMDAGKDFMHLVAPDGAITGSQTSEGIEKLLELTLFSKGSNSLRPQMMAYMVKLTQDVGDAAVQPPISQSQYEAAHGGWSQEDHVEAMSSLMALTWKAANGQKKAIEADQENQKKTVEMFTGLAFSFVPGAGKVLGELGGEGADYLEQIAGKVRDFAWDQAKSAAENGVNGKLEELMSGDSLTNIDSMLGSLRDTVFAVNASLPNGESGELDLRTKFQSAFAFYQLI